MQSTGAARWILAKTSFICFDCPMIWSSPNFWSSRRRRLSISLSFETASSARLISRISSSELIGLVR